MSTTWSKGDGQGQLNQQCWSLDERPWRIFPTFLPWQPFVRMYNSTWTWQGILFDERSLYISTPQWNGISEFPEDLFSVEPVPILAFELLNIWWADARSTHISVGCQIGSRYLEGLLPISGRDVTWWSGEHSRGSESRSSSSSLSPPSGKAA